MPARQLHCGAWVVAKRDQTECEEIAVLCIDCDEPAGCVEHAFFCGPLRSGGL